MKWNYLDLFSGIGGFRLGLEMAGFQWGWTGHSEIDKYANKVYHRHWPDSEDLGDVREISISGDWEQQADTEIGRVRGGIKSERKQPEQSEERGNDIDNQWNSDSTLTTTIQCSTGTYTFSGRINLITFGFPCQDLSIAGKRGGLSANRSGLFFEAMRIVRDAKPDYFVFENVKGLFSSNGGFDWLNVLREVADSGYDGQWQLLNTRVYLPQNRERIFFVGYPSGTGGRQIFPVGEVLSGTTKTQERTGTERERIWSADYTTTIRNSGVDDGMCTLIQVGTIGKDSEATRVYSPDGCARTLKDGGGMGAKTGLYEIKVVGNVYEKGGENGQVYDPSGICRTIKSGETDNPDSGGIGSSNAPKITVGNERRIRRLTPVECARLQGFPDDHCHGLSDTQQYKCYGNSVTTLVVKAVGERILRNE